MPNGDPEYDKYRLLHGGFDPSPDLSPSRLSARARRARANTGQGYAKVINLINQ